jgi:hypothetical protein
MARVRLTRFAQVFAGGGIPMKLANRRIGLAIFVHFLWLAALVACAGCSGEASSPSTLAGAPRADIKDPIAGIADRGDDPAVVLLAAVTADTRAEALCAGTLIAPDVVLTARHCISAETADPACPSAGGALLDPAAVAIRVGNDDAEFALRAHGRTILVPPGAGPCAADIAVLLLDRTIDDIEPVAVRPTGVAQGDHVRTVGFAPGATTKATKIVRDHVLVVQTGESEFRLREVACDERCGGPVVDEATAQIVGVLAGPGLSSEAEPNGGVPSPWDIGTRTDAFAALIERALAAGAPIPRGSGRARTKKGAVDPGANCESAGDCAAGVCVTDASRRYCSATCSTRDRCPAHFRCEKTQGANGAAAACVEI